MSIFDRILGWFYFPRRIENKCNNRLSEFSDYIFNKYSYNIRINKIAFRLSRSYNSLRINICSKSCRLRFETFNNIYTWNKVIKKWINVSALNDFSESRIYFYEIDKEIELALKELEKAVQNVVIRDIIE